LKKKKIIYWSPHLTNIGTINSILNSAKSIKLFSKNKFDVEILELFGEWSNHKEFLSLFDIKVKNIFNPKIYNFIPKKSFLKSRLTYIFFFIFSFFKVKKILKQNEEQILIIHLLTSLPMLVVTIFNLDIKIILRISGKIKNNLIRNFIWKICKHKIDLITCPSMATRNEIINTRIFNKEKIVTLYDPILEPKKINNLKKQEIQEQEIKNKKMILSIGRLTDQKNFSQLIHSYFKIQQENPDYSLTILGEGEQYKNLSKLISSYKLENKVFLLGFKENVFKYIKKSEIFISSSKYEDPGASIIQAVFCNKFVISSNCKNGPTEILVNGKGGILYDLEKESIEESFKKYLKMDKITKDKYILEAKKNSIKYSIFRHYKSLNKLINSI